ncbi:hypothetical protein PVK06_036615 [Gossypium arboreum]|uniref:Uncharacterized protein n=1 Tax=Gossypium arboreum TaxID=29729 RepID=A0ABR0NK02_GOSAR|nr:hypothetical protein PVK06_036615 [Gossypium arboreum]
MIFSSSDSNDGVVRLSSDINIEFVPLRTRLCQTTTVWKVDDYDHSAGKWWVIPDGIKGNPSADTLTSWFRIEKGVFLVTNLSTTPQYMEHAQLYATKSGETQMEIWYVLLSPLTMDGHLSLRKKKVHFEGFNY